MTHAGDLKPSPLRANALHLIFGMNERTGLTRKDLKSQREQTPTSGPSSSGDIAAFVNKVKQMGPRDGAGHGRLLFALDATMSRQPTWDLACSLQAQMFETVAKTGGLDVQLLYFRGFGECQASKWVSDAKAMANLMTGIQCRGGQTQIAKVFSHIRKEQKKRKIDAVIYVGDAMEEDVDKLAHRAGEVGLLGCPMFLFQEGRDGRAERAFREFARLTKGAYARFDANAPHQLSELLKAVAAYASGGRDALKLQSSGSAKMLLEQLR